MLNTTAESAGEVCVDAQNPSVTAESADKVCVDAESPSLTAESTGEVCVDAESPSLTAESTGEVCFDADSPSLTAESTGEVCVNAQNPSVTAESTSEVCVDSASGVGGHAANFSVRAKSAASEVSDDTLAKFEEVLHEISPLPKCKIVRQRKRKADRAEVLTSSPFKKTLMEKIITKNSKSSARSVVGQSQQKKDKTKNKKKKVTCRADKPRGRKPKASLKSEKTAPSAKGRSQGKGSVKMGWSSCDSDSCLICGELFVNSRAGERWIRCQKCSGWCHEDCTGGETTRGFFCDFCS